MAELKTKPNARSVRDFLNGVDPERRADCRALVKLMREVTGKRPVMWGTSMVGFGKYRYRYDSGREGEYFLTGFSPRKRDLTLYIMSGFSGHQALMKKLGKHRTGRSCLYIRKLDDVHLPTLKQLVKRSAAHVAKSSV